MTLACLPQASGQACGGGFRELRWQGVKQVWSGLDPAAKVGREGGANYQDLLGASKTQPGKWNVFRRLRYFTTTAGSAALNLPNQQLIFVLGGLEIL